MRVGQKKGLFITGTDTGVGKTLIGSAIAHILHTKGLRVGVFKPIATGCRVERGKLISDDAVFLAKHADCQLPLTIINPISYITPAAPIVCSKVENRRVDYSRIEDAYLQLCETCDFVIVEGIGGLRVPISTNVDVLEMADQFKLPVVVVARPNLGTINHTLMTVDLIRLNRLPFAGVVINGMKLDADIAEKTAPEVISDVGHVDILSIVPLDAGSSVETGELGIETIKALSPCDWENIASSVYRE